MTAWFQRCALGASLILVAGCGSPQMPFGGTGAMPQGSSIATHVNQGKSWMSSQWRNEVRNPHHKKRLLLYVGVHEFSGSGVVDILDYKTGSLIGQASGFLYPDGLCSDRNGNVYVADVGAGYEIQAGTTNVIKSWSTAPTDGSTTACAVSAGGDVAFTNWESSYEGGGNVKVFPGGGPIGIDYPGPGAFDTPAAYDDKGDLFISSGSLWEIPAGDSSWRPLKSSRPMPWGAVEWDGKYLAVTCNESFEKKGSCIKRVTVSGSTAKVVDNVRLLVRRGLCGRYLNLATWAEDAMEPNGQTTSPASQIAAVDGQCDPTVIDVWSYPAGGTPTRTIDVGPFAGGVTIIKI